MPISRFSASAPRVGNRMSAPDDTAPLLEARLDSVRRRHVIYVEAYDPRGAEGYFEFFARTCDRFERLWPFSLALQPLKIDSEELAHWALDVRGPNWHVVTRYEFLRLEHFIRSDMSRPMPRQVLQALSWLFGDVLNGVHLRFFRASWRFGLHNLSLQSVLLLWLTISAITAVVAGRGAMQYFDSIPVSIIISLIAAFACLAALQPIVKRSYALQLCNSWTVMQKFARGQPSWFDHVVEAGARRLLAVAEASDADELAVVGHSSGCVLALAIVARAMEIDCDIVRRAPRLVLLSLGSVAPGVALHPAARRMRDIIHRLAIVPWLTWIECQSLLDIMCFARFDPVEGIGVHVGERRCNPLTWEISFAEMIAPENYPRFRRNYFRTHFQYIMSGDRPAPYDYILLVGGPFAIADWPKRQPEIVDALLHNRPSAQDR